MSILLEFQHSDRCHIVAQDMTKFKFQQLYIL